MGPQKSEISGNFSCFSSAVLNEGKGFDMAVPNLFSLMPQLYKASNILFCVESTFLSPGLFGLHPIKGYVSSVLRGTPMWNKRLLRK